MKTSRNIAAALLFSSLAFAGTPASAIYYNGQWSLNRYNTGGTSFAVLRPHATNFCYLSRVGVRETDTSTESGICRVRRSGTVWLLEATLGRSSDNDVFCSAICYTTWP